MAVLTRTQRRFSKANALQIKGSGGGSAATGTKATSRQGLISTIGGILGTAVGGPAGGAIGTAVGGAIEGGGQKKQGPGAMGPNVIPPQSGNGRSLPGFERFVRGVVNTGQAAAAGAFKPSPCPNGKIKVGNNCIDPMAAPPGGDPFVTRAGGTATMGAFGLPAVAPVQEQRIHRSCPTGMVLGRDNLCYPRQVLSRRSQFRKWRQPPRPPITPGDVKAIRRAKRAKDRVARLGKDVGLSVSKTRGKSRKQIRNEIELDIIQRQNGSG